MDNYVRGTLTFIAVIFALFPQEHGIYIGNFFTAVGAS